MKGVILAGGTGSRLLPVTKVINKHLLPVGPYPMVYWSILKLKEAGITEIVIITNKESLKDFLKVFGFGEKIHVDLNYKIQGKPAGIADALCCAKSFVKAEKFVVLLGDNIFQDSLTPFIENFQKQDEGARVLLKKIDNIHRFGAAILDEQNQSITSIIEKPKTSNSPFCVTRIYMYDQNVFRYIEQVKPSERGELEISDVNNLYIKDGQLQYDILSGWWIDAGTFQSLHEANCLIYNEMKKGDS